MAYLLNVECPEAQSASLAVHFEVLERSEQVKHRAVIDGQGASLVPRPVVDWFAFLVEPLLPAFKEQEPVRVEELSGVIPSPENSRVLFHGLCRLGKIDWASESHQELDRCLSRTITASKNFND